MELSASKAMISHPYPRHLAAAWTYISKEVDRLHGGAKLENQCNHRKRRISAFGRDSGRGRGRGCYGGRAWGRGRGGGFHQGGGSRGRGMHTEINGINVDDPTCSFTYDEWTGLDQNGGCAYITQQRLYINGHGCGANGRVVGSGGSKRNFGAADVDQNGAQDGDSQDNANHGQNQDVGRDRDRGGQNGGRFGRGAYQHYWLFGALSMLLTYLEAMLILMLLMLILVLPCHKQSYKPNCIITVISKQIIGQTKRDPGDFSNPTTPGHVERNEFDSHAYTCCAGANWTPMLYTGELCAVSPFLSTYEPVQDIPVSRCCTVWTSDKGKEYLFFGNEMLWFGNTLVNLLMNPKQLRA